LTTDEQILNLAKFVKNITGYDFTEYSIKSFQRRIDKILEDYRLEYEELVKQIKKLDPIFIEKFIADITVNTTEVFRNPTVWHSVKYRILPKLKDNDRIDIWHAGCSTGQEVYSMLILLNEFDLLHKTNIYASDINTFALKQAEKGEYIYRFNIEYLQNFDEVIRKNPYNFEEYNDVPYSKYFDIDQAKDKITIKDFLKNKAVFKRQDLVKRENIFGKQFDLIMCRNVLIYFNLHLQSRVLNYFYDSLKFPGYLVLGYHESILGNEAVKFHKKHYYYTKKLI
jgi:chemotaxis protein methyltransferase CheR